MVFHGVRRIPRRKEVHIQIAIAGNCGATAFFFFFFLRMTTTSNTGPALLHIKQIIAF